MHIIKKSYTMTSWFWSNLLTTFFTGKPFCKKCFHDVVIVVISITVGEKFPQNSIVNIDERLSHEFFHRRFLCKTYFDAVVIVVIATTLREKVKKYNIMIYCWITFPWFLHAASSSSSFYSTATSPGPHQRIATLSATPYGSPGDYPAPGYGTPRTPARHNASYSALTPGRGDSVWVDSPASQSYVPSTRRPIHEQYGGEFCRRCIVKVQDKWWQGVFHKD